MNGFKIQNSHRLPAIAATFTFLLPIYVSAVELKISHWRIFFHFNPRRHRPKKVARGHLGGGGGQSDPSPLLSTPFIRLT